MTAQDKEHLMETHDDPDGFDVRIVDPDEGDDLDDETLQDYFESLGF